MLQFQQKPDADTREPCRLRQGDSLLLAPLADESTERLSFSRSGKKRTRGDSEDRRIARGKTIRGAASRVNLPDRFARGERYSPRPMQSARTLDPVERVFATVDPRLASDVRVEFEQATRHDDVQKGLRNDARWVLAGHRAAGKSTLLPLIADLCGRRGVDLDHELERQHGAPIREWFGSDPAGFRAAERTAFSTLPQDVLVAVGGGFLSHHADLLDDAVVILVPVSFETYRERLLADRTRPRLRPELTLEQEIRTTFEERERVHAGVPTVSLAQALAALQRGGCT